MFEGTGTGHYLGVPLFLKIAEFSASVFEICAELCRIIVTILGKYCKITGIYR